MGVFSGADRPPTHGGAEPFRWWVWDGWCEPARPGDLPPADWGGWEAGYANDVERGKQAARAVGLLPPAVGAVFARLTAPAAAGDWAARLGSAAAPDPLMHGGGLHRTAAGGWLQVHLDYAAHPALAGSRRCLNLIAFLHPEWRDGWGGSLLLCDPSGAARVKVRPTPGRLAAFEVSDRSYHGVEQTAADAPPRVTAAVYYLAAATPADTRTRALFMPNRCGPGRPPHEVRPGVPAALTV